MKRDGAENERTNQHCSFSPRVCGDCKKTTRVV
jgi:hypothetical protein